MDPAVALVRAYLQLNGYFTVAEYPVLVATRTGGYQMATDLDVLAFRFSGAGRHVPGRRTDDLPSFRADPELGVPSDRADMLIGEVKEGRAGLNPAARDRDVLEVAIVRFGCCSREHAPQAVDGLLRHGRTRVPRGHDIRLVAFGAKTGGTAGAVDAIVSLGHVTDYLRSYLRDHWDVLRHAQFKDPVLGFLLTMEKATR